MTEPMRYLTRNNVFELLVEMGYTPDEAEQLVSPVHKAKIYRNREDTQTKVDAVIKAYASMQVKVDSNV
jgi:Holliday junction resolvasome RuvABC DNA-binding subunit